MVSSNTGRGYGSNFVTALAALKSTQNLYLSFPPTDLLGTSIAGATHGEEDSLIIAFASMFSTYAFITTLSAKGILYCGRLMGFVSSSSTWCSITSVAVKSLVSSSSKSCAYFHNTGSSNCLSFLGKWFYLPLTV